MGMREPSPLSTRTPPPRHNGGRPARPLCRPRSPGRVAGCFGRTQTLCDVLGRGGGRVLTSWPIRSKLSRKYFTDSPCAGETHTAQAGDTVAAAAETGRHPRVLGANSPLS